MFKKSVRLLCLLITNAYALNTSETPHLMYQWGGGASPIEFSLHISALKKWSASPSEEVSLNAQFHFLESHSSSVSFYNYTLFWTPHAPENSEKIKSAFNVLYFWVKENSPHPLELKDEDAMVIKGDMIHLLDNL